MYGGADNDGLDGGKGSDIFVFEKFDGDHVGDQIMDFEIGTDKIRVQADWIENGWISLDIVSVSDDNKVDVAITVAQPRYADATWDYVTQHNALPPGFDLSNNTKTLRNINYEDGVILEILSSSVEMDNILFEVV